MLDDDAKEADIRMLQKDLDAKLYVKSTEYVSKDEAAAKMKEDLGEDFINFLGDNPFLLQLMYIFMQNIQVPTVLQKSKNMFWNIRL